MPQKEVQKKRTHAMVREIATYVIEKYTNHPLASLAPYFGEYRL